ncbi:MAG: hypothetical protein Q9191_008107, partial [Dirinaria sp. TL-2023a]
YESLAFRRDLASDHRQLLRIESVAYDGWSSPADVYLPVIRNFMLFNPGKCSVPPLDVIHEAPVIEHIDVCTAWKGISFAQASLLLCIHQAFERAISSLVSDQLTDIPLEAVPQSWIPHCTPADRFSVEQDSVVITRRLTLSPSQLANTLKSILSAQNHDDKELFQDCGEGLVGLYLSKSDCLLVREPSDPNDGATDICIEYVQSKTTPALPRIRARWNPEFLSFTKIDYQPREGQQLIIVPHYRCGPFARTGGEQVRTIYSLETPVTWLHWDDHLSGWRGTVPFYSRSRGQEHETGKVYRGRRSGPHAVTNILRIEIKAIRTEWFKEIHVERTIRSRLTLKVLPFWSREFTPGSRVASLNQTASQENPDVLCPGRSRVVSRDARPLDANEPSTYVSPKPTNARPAESEARQPVIATVPKGQPSVFRPYWANERQDLEQTAIDRCKDLDDPFKNSPAAMARELDHSGSPECGKNRPTGLDDYAATTMRAPGIGDFTQGMGDIGSGSTYHGFKTFKTQPSSPTSLKRLRQGSSGEELQGWLHELRDSMAKMRATLERSHVPPTPVSNAFAWWIDDAAGQEEMRHEASIHSRAPTESESVFSQEQVLHPASAEVFALAEVLHGQTPKDRTACKRSRAASFEESPGKKAREDRFQSSNSITSFSSPQNSPRPIPVTPMNVSEDGHQQLCSPPTSGSLEVGTQDQDESMNSGLDSNDDSRSEFSVENGAAIPHGTFMDAYADPAIRSEHALLWEALREQDEGANKVKLSVDERKQLFEALKQSMAIEDRRQNAMLGIHHSADFSMSEAGSKSHTDTNSEEDAKDDSESSSSESNAAPGSANSRIRFGDGNVNSRRLVVTHYDEDDKEKTELSRGIEEDTTAESPLIESSTPSEAEAEDTASDDANSLTGLTDVFRSPTSTPSASSFRTATAAAAESILSPATPYPSPSPTPSSSSLAPRGTVPFASQSASRIIIITPCSP